MEINVGTKTVEESNEFLRCLWAEMEKEFGMCDWGSYSPRKNGAEQRVFFGYMLINEGHIAVSMSYKNKGSINNLYFISRDKNNEIERGTVLYSTLKKVVNAAKKNLENYQEYDFSIIIKSRFPLMPYKGNNFEIKFISYEESSRVAGVQVEVKDKRQASYERSRCDAGFKVDYKVKAYNKRQAYHYTDKMMRELMDFLAVETDDVFWSDLKDIDFDELKFEEKFLEREFGNTNELYCGFRRISTGGKQFLDFLTDSNRTDNPDLNLFMKACNHFHTARLQEEQIIKGYLGEDIGKMGTSHAELATTLYLSALEVICLIGFKEEKICKDCGQQKYEISSRIIDMVSKYIPGESGNLFRKFYEQRSNYLHQGRKLRTNMPWQFIYPQLDVNEEDLCENSPGLYVSYIRECVGYCLRSYYKDKFLK